MKIRAYFYLLAVLLALPIAANARPVTIEYTLSATDCVGDAVDVSDYTDLEIYFDSVSIPITAVDSCDFVDENSDGVMEPVDIPPSSAATVIPGTFEDPDGDGRYTVSANLQPGVYYVRARVMMGGTWSNLSNQIQQTVPPGNGRPPFLIRLNI